AVPLVGERRAERRLQSSAGTTWHVQPPTHVQPAIGRAGASRTSYRPAASRQRRHAPGDAFTSTSPLAGTTAPRSAPSRGRRRTTAAAGTCCAYIPARTAGSASSVGAFCHFGGIGTPRCQRPPQSRHSL